MVSRPFLTQLMQAAYLHESKDFTLFAPFVVAVFRQMAVAAYSSPTGLNRATSNGGKIQIKITEIFNGNSGQKVHQWNPY